MQLLGTNIPFFSVSGIITIKLSDMVQIYNLNGGNWRSTKNCVFPSAKKQKNKPRASLHKIDNIFFAFFFFISSNSYPVPPSRVSAQFKYNHIAYFAIYSHSNCIWEKILFYKWYKERKEEERKEQKKERRMGWIKKDKDQNLNWSWGDQNLFPESNNVPLPGTSISEGPVDRSPL